MRIISLYFLRFLAAMSVAVPHLVIYFELSENLVILEIVTSLAVEVFFVLSGFVLCPFLARIFESPTGKKKNLLIFLVRRWMQTLPLYFLSLTFFVILFSGNLDKIALQYLLFLQNFNWPPPEFDYFSVSWSLAVEEWFYILFPAFIVLFFQFWSTVRPIENRGTVFLLGTIGFIIFFTVLRVFADVPSENWGYNIRRVVLFRIDSIGFGIFLYLLKDFIYKIPIPMIFATIVAMLVYLFTGYERIHVGASNIFESRLFIFFATALFSCAILSLFLRLESLFVNRLKQVSLWGGRVSYGIYLFHIPVAALVGKQLDVPAGLFMAVSITMTLVVTSGIYHFLEKPILSARPGFRFDKETGPTHP